MGLGIGEKVIETKAPVQETKIAVPDDVLRLFAGMLGIEYVERAPANASKTVKISQGKKRAVINSAFASFMRTVITELYNAKPDANGTRTIPLSFTSTPEHKKK